MWWVTSPCQLTGSCVPFREEPLSEEDSDALHDAVVAMARSDATFEAHVGAVDRCASFDACVVVGGHTLYGLLARLPWRDDFLLSFWSWMIHHWKMVCDLDGGIEATAGQLFAAVAKMEDMMLTAGAVLQTPFLPSICWKCFHGYDGLQYRYDWLTH